jgi:5-methylcytosine-specific restriction enzyme subunit McrC
MSETRVHLREWQTLGPEDTRLRGVHLAGNDARALARRLTESGIVEIVELYDGIRVRALAHVGRIHVGGLVITIEPKIGSAQLLELLRYTYGLRNLQLFDITGFATTGQLLQDLICAQLFAEVSELVKRGLARRYVGRSELLSSPRGRLDINDLARRSPLRSARITCRYHQRSTDHLLNQVVSAGLRLASHVAQDPPLRRSLARLAKRLGEEIGGVRLGTSVLDHARRRLDRLSTAYAPALRLSELLYACSAVSLDGEATTELPGFLFDMNRFFQALMERFLRENLHNCDVKAEHGLAEMMRYMAGLNPRGRRSPRPRPDFLILGGGKVAALLDAKYRDLWERDLPRDMLYQLAIYALSQPKAATAAILFPTIIADATAAVIEIRDPLRAGALGYVALRPVVLGELLEAVRVDGDPDRRVRLAKRLAFGTSQELVRIEWSQELATRVGEIKIVDQTRAEDGATAGVQTAP